MPKKSATAIKELNGGDVKVYAAKGAFKIRYKKDDGNWGGTTSSTIERALQKAKDLAARQKKGTVDQPQLSALDLQILEDAKRLANPLVDLHKLIARQVPDRKSIAFCCDELKAEYDAGVKAKVTRGVEAPKKTARTAKTRLNRVKDSLGATYVDALTPNMVKEWVEAMLFDYAPDNVGKILGHLKQVVTHARHKGYVPYDFDPFAGVKKPEETRQTVAYIWTTEKLAEVLAGLEAAPDTLKTINPEGKGE